MEIQNLNDIRGFLQLTDRIATSGQPRLRQFPAIKDAGYTAVINLADHGEFPDAEPATWAELGLDYAHIPVVWERPTLADAQQFFGLMQQREGQNVYVHCVANMRVSAFMYLYRITQLGMPEPDARRDLNKLWTPNPTWQAFIDEVLQHFGTKK